MKEAESQKTPMEYTAGFNQAMRGKHISASIIVLAGALLILGGSYLRHDDTKLFVQVVGCIVLTVGLAGWLVSVNEK